MSILNDRGSRGDYVRHHDLRVIAVIGAIWLLIELGFLKGTPGPNRFGSPVTD